MTAAYLGPNRRRAERRQTHTMNLGDPRDRRSYGPDADRRQQALCGVVSGMTAEDMQRLLEVHRKMESRRQSYFVLAISTPRIALTAGIFADSEEDAKVIACRLHGGSPADWMLESEESR
jgi:hypothetical protein